MGSKVPPDPGDFETGNDCDLCTTGHHPIFLPGQTPKYVQLRIFADYELIDTQILTQDPESPCAWNLITPAGVHYNWWNYVPDWCHLTRWWMENAVTHYSFDYFDHPYCQTKVPNQIDPDDPDYLGDSARVTWGEGIEPEP